MKACVVHMNVPYIFFCVCLFFAHKQTRGGNFIAPIVLNHTQNGKGKWASSERVVTSLQLVVFILIRFCFDVRGLSVLLEEGDKAIHCAVTIVLDGLLVLSGREEVNGGEPLHADARVRDLVGSGIHLGNDHLVAVLELLAHLLKHWREFLAVATPRRVELQQHILTLLQGDFCKRLAAHHDHGALQVGVLGLLRLEQLFQVAIEEILPELGQRLLVDRLVCVQAVLLEGATARHVHHDWHGQVLLLETKEVHHASLRWGHHNGKQLAKEGARDLLHGVHNVVVALGLWVGKHQQVGLHWSAKDLGGVLLGELHHQWHAVQPHKPLHGVCRFLFLVVSLERDGAVVERSDHHKGRSAFRSHTGSLLEQIGVRRQEELCVVDGQRDLLVRLRGGAVVVLEIRHSHGLLVLHELVQVILGRELLRRGPALLAHPIDNGLGRAAAAVLHRLATTEELQSREPLDAEALRQFAILRCIHLRRKRAPMWFDDSQTEAERRPRRTPEGD